MERRNKFNVDEKLNQSFNFAMMGRSFVYIKQQKWLFARAITFQVIAILVGLMGPVCSKIALDDGVAKGDMRTLLIYSGLMIATIAVNIFFVTIAARTSAIIGQNIILNLRRDLYAHLQKLSFDYYDSRPHGKILVRIINYVNSVSNMLSNGLINLLLQMLNLVFISIFMFALDVRLSLVVLAGLPFAVAFVTVIKPMQRRGWQAHSNKVSNMNAYFNETIVCMRITQLFAREEHNIKVCRQLVQDAKKMWYRAVRPTMAVQPVIDLIRKSVIVALLFYGIYVAQPMVSFGVLMAMMQYCMRFWQPIAQIANIYNDFINNIAYLERIFETIDEPIMVTDKAEAGELSTIKGEVYFDDVTFCYLPGIPVLNNVNFTVKAGESVALVGPTGSGKTTIINLLSRFYDCTEGIVYVDGQDISNVTLASLRSQMGLMMQDSFIFSDTVYENLRYGNLNATDEQLIAAAKLVCADEFIRNLPKGYDTVLSEGGAILSQGQRQLIALARTMASDPRILILDEATSAIDTKTERALQEGLNRALQGRTSFIVAHRLSTIQACDKIMFIQKGKIVEVGSHTELMAKKGAYYALHQSA